MRTRRLHGRLAYVKRADNRASVAFAAASTFVRTPRPPRVAYAEASCRPRLRGKKRLEVGLRIACLAWLRIACLAWLGSLAHMMRTRRLHARLCARMGKAFGARLGKTFGARPHPATKNNAKASELAAR